MQQHVFYSWQADTATATGKNLVGRALRGAIAMVNADSAVEDFDRDDENAAVFDHDTEGVRAFLTDIILLAARTPPAPVELHPNDLKLVARWRQLMSEPLRHFLREHDFGDVYAPVRITGDACALLCVDVFWQTRSPVDCAGPYRERRRAIACQSVERASRGLARHSSGSGLEWQQLRNSSDHRATAAGRRLEHHY